LVVSKIIRAWNDLFAPKEFVPFFNKHRIIVMRRWRGGAWEERPPTVEEAHEVRWQDAIR
jgi:hypothetical protein